MIRDQLIWLRYPQRSSCSKGMAKNVIGGHSEQSCSSVSSVSLPNCCTACTPSAKPTGYPPFCSENAHDVYRKIIEWRNHLFFPDDVHLSREAEDLIRRMLCEADRRFTVEQLKAHPVCRSCSNLPFHRELIHPHRQADMQFFYGVDWATIRDIDAPFVPHLRSITDTSYFPTDELDQASEIPSAPEGADAKKDLAFLGYT